MGGLTKSKPLKCLEKASSRMDTNLKIMHFRYFNFTNFIDNNLFNYLWSMCVIFVCFMFKVLV